MSHIDRIKSDIQRAIAAGRVRKSELARQAGIPLTTLIGMERRDWNPSSFTLGRLEVALAELLPDRERKPHPKKRAAYQPAA